MDSKDEWNIIVEQYDKLYNENENVIQKEWESYFSEMFDYKKILGEIESQRNMHIGSHERVIPDIILKKDGKDLIDIELKQYNMSFNDDMEKQLESYLKLLRLSVGAIICNKIYLYYFDYNVGNNYKIAIDFKKDNSMGIEFINLLQKNNFSEQKVSEYIDKYMKSKEDIKSIKEELDQDLIQRLLKEYFVKKYNEREIDIVLSKYKFIIESKNQSILSKTKPVNPVILSDSINDDSFPMEPNYLIIKTSHKRVQECKGNLYNATRHCWNVKYDTVIKYKYVLSVIDQRVQEVYEVRNWQDAEAWDIDNGNAKGRLEFVGDVAPEEVRKAFIGKLIPYKYRKVGMSNPVVYSH